MLCSVRLDLFFFLLRFLVSMGLFPYWLFLSFQKVFENCFVVLVAPSSSFLMVSSMSSLISILELGLSFCSGQLLRKSSYYTFVSRISSCYRWGHPGSLTLSCSLMILLGWRTALLECFCSLILLSRVHHSARFPQRSGTYVPMDL